MEVYRTEEEQLEQLKSWLRENGRTLIIAIVLVIAAVFGWRAWHQHQANQQERAAASYLSLLDAVGQIEQGEGGGESMQATANTLADSLKVDHTGSGYAQLAALLKARLAVDAGDLAAAETELRWVLERKPVAELAALTRLRLARVLLAKGEADAALAQLQQPGAYAFAYAHVRGDILLSKGDNAGAHAAYEESQQLGRALQPAFDDPVLELKLHALRPAQSDAGAGNNAES